MLPVPARSGPFDPHRGVVIGLGANLGDPEGQLRSAAQALELRVGPLLASSLYASEPIGPEQPDFLNSAVLVDTQVPLLDLLRVTREIEAQLGRVRRIRWGPRLIDLDILWAGERTSACAELVVPHALLTTRAFALLPLLELCPDATMPGTGAFCRSFLPDVHSQRIRALRGPDWWKGP